MLMASTNLPCLKGRFPFRLGTTSYILPDAIIPNVFLAFRTRWNWCLESAGRTTAPRGHRHLSPGRGVDLTYNVHSLRMSCWAIPIGDPDYVPTSCGSWAFNPATLYCST